MISSWAGHLYLMITALTPYLQSLVCFNIVNCDVADGHQESRITMDCYRCNENRINCIRLGVFPRKHKSTNQILKHFWGNYNCIKKIQTIVLKSHHGPKYCKKSKPHYRPPTQLLVAHAIHCRSIQCITV